MHSPQILSLSLSLSRERERERLKGVVACETSSACTCQPTNIDTVYSL